MLTVSRCGVLALFFAGCVTPPDRVGSDAGAGDAATGEGRAADSAGPAALRFEANVDPGGGPAVFLRAVERDAVVGDTFWLEVVAHRVPGLQGVAFRLVFDPGALEVRETVAADVWRRGPGQTVHRFKVRPDGELWAGLGHVGRRSFPATRPVALARVKLHLKAGAAKSPGAGSGPPGATAAALSIGFRPGHNLVLGADGGRVGVRWSGGVLRPVHR